MFYNLWVKFNINFILLDIKFHFICGESNLHSKTLNCKKKKCQKYVFCLKINHLHLISLTTIEISGNNLILVKPRKLYQKTFTNCSRNFFNHSSSDPGQRGKTNWNFYFCTSLWCLKRFYEGLKDLHKTFWGTTEKCENKNLS